MENGRFCEETMRAIIAFQRHVLKMTFPDGVVDILRLILSNAKSSTDERLGRIRKTIQRARLQKNDYNKEIKDNYERIVSKSS